MGVLKACIVITGGPCAGKTVTVSEVKEDLERHGYHVLLFNECATELILGGIKPFGDNSISVFDFQHEVLNLQRYKEKRYFDIVKKFPEDTKCIILMDRGILDSKAYLGEELWNELLIKNNLKEEDLTNQYDLVIDLQTVAAEIKNKYNTTTNVARFEDPDNAIDVDKKTFEAWKDSKNFRVVEATEVIEEKVSQVLNIIHNFLDTNEK